MKSVKGNVSFREMKETKRRHKKKQLVNPIIAILVTVIVVGLATMPITADAFGDEMYNDVDSPEVRFIEEIPEIEEDEYPISTMSIEIQSPERVDEESTSESDTEDDLFNDKPETVEENTYRCDFTDEEYDILCRVVEAEVTGYDVWIQKGLTHDQIIDAKTRVAQVFINRMESSRFEETTLKSTLFKKNATSTLLDGRYYDVVVTDYTREAVNKALSIYTPDLTGGALFFSSGKANRQQVLFKDAVGHYFGI